MKLKTMFKDDGANWQAQCVAIYLKRLFVDDINLDKINVIRYENCREQGYLFYIKIKKAQLNIAIYEHRNSDNLCVVYNEIVTANAPTNETIWETMQDKWDVNKHFDCGEIVACGDYIYDVIQDFFDFPF